MYPIHLMHPILFNWYLELGLVFYSSSGSMADNKLPFAEGASISRPPIFNGVNYQFWKVRMKIFIESIDCDIWNAIVNDPFIPMTIVGGVTVEKSFDELTDVENKKVQYHCIAKNIITSALNLDEFFKVSQCNSEKRCGIFLRLLMKVPLT